MCSSSNELLLIQILADHSSVAGLLCRDLARENCVARAAMSLFMARPRHTHSMMRLDDRLSPGTTYRARASVNLICFISLPGRGSKFCERGKEVNWKKQICKRKAMRRKRPTRQEAKRGEMSKELLLLIGMRVMAAAAPQSIPAGDRGSDG